MDAVGTLTCSSCPSSPHLPVHSLPHRSGHHFRVVTLHWQGINHTGCVQEKERVLWFQRTMNTEACRCSCQVTQLIPTPTRPHPQLCETRRRGLPTTPPSSGQMVPAGAGGKGKHLWPPQRERSNKFGFFIFFFCKHKPDFSNFKRRREVKGHYFAAGMMSPKALCHPYPQSSMIIL